MVTKSEAFRGDPVNVAKCDEVLERIRKHVDGETVLYASEYGRPDNRLNGASTARVAQWAFDNALKAASHAISSGLPTDGWFLVTPSGLAVFSRKALGDRIGSHKGTIPHELVSSVSISHGKKLGRCTIDVMFADHSEATMFTKTKVTYPAISRWTDLMIATGEATPAEAPTFDANVLFDSNPGLSH